MIIDSPSAPASRGFGPRDAAAGGDPTPRAESRSRAGTERLGALDASFLHLETPTTAMHVGAVATFAAPPDQPGHPDHCPGLLERIGERIGAAPRYRQKLRWLPGRVLPPVWVEDPDFDVGHHLRRHSLPAPGCDAQLAELAAGIQSQQLDRDRPLWELHLVEGLTDHRFALVIKIHHALVDGIGGLDLSRLLFDAAPTATTRADARSSPPGAALAAGPPARSRPGARPVSTLRLTLDGLADITSRPAGMLAALPTHPAGLRAAARDALRRAGGLPTAAGTVLRPALASPINTGIGVTRQLATARTRLTDYERARTSHGGTINDVVLATVAGALGDWLHQRGEPVPATLRALIPVNRRGPARAAAPGNHVSAYLVDLPVADPDPVRDCARSAQPCTGTRHPVTRPPPTS